MRKNRLSEQHRLQRTPPTMTPHRRTTATLATTGLSLLLGVLVALGTVQPPSRAGGLARAELAAAPAADVVLAGVEQAVALPPLTTTTVPPTTAAPTTTPPTTAAPTTAAPTTAAPATVPPTTAAPAPTAPAPPTAVAASSGRDTACESSTLTWMNQTRAGRGLPALVEDEGIQHVSADWAARLAAVRDLSHNPDYGPQIFSLRPQAGTAGENVGYASTDARAVYDEFLRSPGHHDKIVNPAYSAVTVGCSIDAEGWTWVVIDFWG